MTFPAFTHSRGWPSKVNYLNLSFNARSHPQSFFDKTARDNDSIRQSELFVFARKFLLAINVGRGIVAAEVQEIADVGSVQKRGSKPDT